MRDGMQEDLNKTDFAKHSTCYDSAQDLQARIERRTAEIFGDRLRDIPLRVGFGESPVIAAVVGLSLDGLPAPLAHAMGSILCGAVIAHRAGGRGVSFSLMADRYTGLGRRYHPSLTRTYVRGAVERLEAASLISVAWGKSWADGGQGRQSTMYATPALIERAGDMPFQKPVLREIIRLYDANGSLVTYQETSQTKAMRNSLREWNDDLASRRIEITDSSVIRQENGLCLVPTKDEDGEYLVRADQVEAYRRFKGNFDLMGRFVGPGYQSLTKAVRSTITIDEDALGSADFSCSHLRQAYGQAGADPGETDAYTIAGHENRRHLVKVATNIAINCTKGRGEALNTIAYEIAKADHASETGSTTGARVGPFELGQADRILTAIETRHRPVERFFYSGAGIAFMKVEADILDATASTARKRYAIPVLGIHDEMMGPADKIGIVADIMAAEWSKRVSAQPIVRHS
ncbi:hypothetical protein [Methylobacterium sp. CM6247]